MAANLCELLYANSCAHTVNLQDRQASNKKQMVQGAGKEDSSCVSNKTSTQGVGHNLDTAVSLQPLSSWLPARVYGLSAAPDRRTQFSSSLSMHVRSAQVLQFCCTCRERTAYESVREGKRASNPSIGLYKMEQRADESS